MGRPLLNIHINELLLENIVYANCCAMYLNIALAQGYSFRFAENSLV